MHAFSSCTLSSVMEYCECVVSTLCDGTSRRIHLGILSLSYVIPSTSLCFASLSQVVLRASAAVVWVFLDPSLLDTSSYPEWTLESTYGSLSRLISLSSKCLQPLQPHIAILFKSPVCRLRQSFMDANPVRDNFRS